MTRRDAIRYGQAGLSLGDEAIREGAAAAETKVVDEYVITPYIGEKEK